MRIYFESLDAGPQTLTSQLLSSHLRACLQKLIYHSWELCDASGPRESENGSDDKDAAAGRAGRGGIGGRGGGRGGGGGGGVADAVHPEPVSPRMAARTPLMPPTTLLVLTPIIPSRSATTTAAGTSITFVEMHCASLAAKRVVTATLLASMCSLQPSERCNLGLTTCAYAV